MLSVVLDTHALHSISFHPRLFAAIKIILMAQPDTEILVPVPVLAEAITGNPKYDTHPNISLNRLGTADLTEYCARRAGHIRTLTIRSTSPLGSNSRGEPSAVDALVIATAEQARQPAHVFTSDVADLAALAANSQLPNSIAIRPVP